MQLVLPIFLFLGCSSPETATTVEAVDVGPGKLNPVSVGQLVVELEATKARPRVYNFWATWCRPCMAEIPSLRAFGESHPEIEVVFVNVDQPSLHTTRVPATIQRHELGAFRHLGVSDSDPAYALTKVKGWPNSIPVTMIVAPSGKRVRQFNTRVNEATLTRSLKAIKP